MIVVTNSGPVYGPFKKVEVQADRLRCDGADLPYNVIGMYQTLDQDLPPDSSADQCTWSGGAVVLLNPAALAV